MDNYPAGIAWIDTDDLGTITIDWVNDTSTKIRISVQDNA